MDTFNLVAGFMLAGTLLGIAIILLLEVVSERIDVGKELDELLKDLPDIEDDDVQVYPWFAEDDLVMCIEKSAIDLVVGAVYVVESAEIRNNIEFIRLRELSHTGISYYAKSFTLIGE